MIKPQYNRIKIVSLLCALLLASALLNACARNEKGGNDASGSLETSNVVTASPDKTKVPEASASADASIQATATPDTTTNPDTAAGSTQKPTQTTMDGRVWPIPKGLANDASVTYGYADTEGRFVIEPIYKRAMPFTTSGLAIVSDADDNRSVIDLNGQMLIPWRHAAISVLPEGLILARVSEDTYDYDHMTTEVYNASGKLLFTHPGYLEDFSEDYAVSTIAGKAGYIDISGNLAIPVKAENLGAFQGTYALVAEKFGREKHYIDRQGQDMTKLVSEGFAVFYDSDKSLFGYLRPDGSRLTEALYIEAEPFRNGTAIVLFNPDPAAYGGVYGLIDTSGKYRINPEHSGIRRLENGTFAVGEKLNNPSYIPYNYMSYGMLALYDAGGYALTKEIYTTVEDAGDGLTVLCDGKTITFVNTEGQKASDMPSIPGQGSLAAENGYLVGTVDGFDTVLDKKGNAIVVLRNNILLNKGLLMTDEKVTGSRFTNVSYPVLSGLTDGKVEQRINASIRRAMGQEDGEPLEKDPDSGMTYVVTVEGSWTAWLLGDILCVEQDTYAYPIGAAHGMPNLQTLHMNLRNGNTLALTDLFDADKQQKALDFLTGEVTESITEDMDDVGYFETGAQVLPDQAFRLTKDGLELYWPPYALASYAAGFQDFLIPWEDLSPYISELSHMLLQLPS